MDISRASSIMNRMEWNIAEQVERQKSRGSSATNITQDAERTTFSEEIYQVVKAKYYTK